MGKKWLDKSKGWKMENQEKCYFGWFILNRGSFKAVFAVSQKLQRINTNYEFIKAGRAGGRFYDGQEANVKGEHGRRYTVRRPF